MNGKIVLPTGVSLQGESPEYVMKGVLHAETMLLALENFLRAKLQDGIPFTQAGSEQEVTIHALDQLAVNRTYYSSGRYADRVVITRQNQVRLRTGHLV